jgi:hypothetical protein
MKVRIVGSISENRSKGFPWTAPGNGAKNLLYRSTVASCVGAVLSAFDFEAWNAVSNNLGPDTNFTDRGIAYSSKNR